MIENIGNIMIDYTFYDGKDIYSDGEIEDKLLETVMKGKELDALRAGTSWPVLYHLSDIRENLLEWYPIRKHAKILEIGAGCGALTGLLSSKAEKVVCIELSKKRSLINAYKNADCSNVTIYVGNFKDIEPNLTEQFDYITLIGVLEYSSLYLEGENPYLKMLETAKRHLADDGRLIIAIENKMGLKYWNGAAEDHTGRIGSGLNDYSEGEGVRTFSKRELTELIKKAGIKCHRMYYPTPDYKLPEAIYSESFQPGPGDIRNYGKDYDMPRFYQFNDAAVSDQICEDKMFSYFSNSFLIAAGEDKEEFLFEKYGRCRRDRFQIRTEIIKKNGEKFVKKTALHKDAKEHILKIKENERKWTNRLPNIQCVEGYLDCGSYVTPYINGQDLDKIFYYCRHDSAAFIEQFKYFIGNFLTPDDKELIPFEVSPEFIQVFGEHRLDGKKSLKYTNIDLIFSNLKMSDDGRMYAFDYEWCFDFSIPFEYVIWRAAWRLHEQYKPYFRDVLRKEDFMTAIGISGESSEIYMKMERNFGIYVFGNQEGENYLPRYRKNAVMQNITFR